MVAWACLEDLREAAEAVKAAEHALEAERRPPAQGDRGGR
jgi:hypothetical protein